MSYLSIKSNAYSKKLSEHKKVKSIHDDSEKRPKDSPSDNIKNNLKRNEEKSKKQHSLNKKNNQKSHYTEIKSRSLIHEVKKVIYIILSYPKKTEISVEYDTGDIITDIVMIPKNYWKIISFNPKTFPKHKTKIKLYDVAYWAAFENTVQYISQGNIVPLLKNK